MLVCRPGHRSRAGWHCLFDRGHQRIESLSRQLGTLGGCWWPHNQRQHLVLTRTFLFPPVQCSEPHYNSDGTPRECVPLGSGGNTAIRVCFIELFAHFLCSYCPFHSCQTIKDWNSHFLSSSFFADNQFCTSPARNGLINRQFWSCKL